MMTTLRALVIAFSMYSQIPMPQFTWQDKEMKYAFCFFPWVGAAIGGITMFWWWFCGKFSVGNVAFAMIGSSISGVTYVSVPGMVAASSFGYLQMVLGFVAGQFIIAFVLTPLFYRMNLVSIYEYLENRFGMSSYRTGAWFFFISKMLGAAVRLFLVCLTLQLLVFEPFGLPFILNVAITVALVWLYTFRGGVKSLIWTDSLKTFCLVVSVVLCISYIASDLNLSLSSMISTIADSDMSRIVMTGLDQDMMQRNLSCKNFKDSQKNMITSVISQFFVILLFLMLGVLLYIFAGNQGIQVEKSDELFPLIATGNYFPAIVGILFIIGLISSAYSAAGSALTALTTSFTVDILGTKGRTEEEIVKIRKRVHIGMAVIMGITIFVFNLLNNTSVIDAVYILASYTYGPILGLFAFGIFMKQQVRDKYIPLVAILSPILCFILQKNSEAWFNGYQFSYELLIFNALFTFIGLCLLIRKDKN